MMTRYSLPLTLVFVLSLLNTISVAQSWSELLAESDSLMENGKIKPAITKIDSALASAREVPELPDTTIASILYKKATFQYRAGDHVHGEKTASESLKIREEELGGMDPEVNRSRVILGIFLMENGNLSAADSLFDVALDFYRLKPVVNQDRIAAVLTNKAIVRQKNGQYRQAISYAVEAVQLSLSVEEPNYEGIAESLHTLGELYRKAGIYDSSEVYLQRSLDLRKDLYSVGHPKIAVAQNSLGILFEFRGKYAAAKFAFQEALNIRVQNYGERHRSVFATRNNLANLYIGWRLFDLAEAEYRKILSTYPSLESRTDSIYYSYFTGNLGAALLMKEEYTAARRYFDESIEIKQQLSPRSLTLASGMENFAVLLASTDAKNEAEELFWRAQELKLSIQGYVQYGMATSIYNLAKLKLDQGNSRLARLMFHQSLDLREKLLGEDHPSVAGALEGLAKTYRLHGDHETALDYILRALEIRKVTFHDGSRVMAHADALNFTQKLHESAGTLITMLLDAENDTTDKSREIAAIALYIKGLATDAVFARQRSIVTETDSSTIILADSLADTRLRLSNVRSAKSTTKIAELDSLTRDKNRLEETLVRQSPNFRREYEMRVIDGDAVAKLLPSGSAYVQYLKYEHEISPMESECRYLGIVVKSDQGISIIPLGDAETIDELADEYHAHTQFISRLVEARTAKGIKVKFKELNKYSGKFKKIAQGLHELLWEPVEKELQDSSLVFISPDGKLARISFATLYNESATYLIERHPIQYLLSARDLVRLSGDFHPGAGALIMGDPDTAGTNYRKLKYASKEMKSAKRFAENHGISPVLLYSQEQANELNFKSAVEEKLFVHLATHGGYDADEGGYQSDSQSNECSDMDHLLVNPLTRTFIVMSLGQESDSNHSGIQIDERVTAEEILSLNLSGLSFAALPACESATGESVPMEGVYDIRRAFHLSGARTVLGSLFNVDDEISFQIIENLYYKLSTNPELSIPHAMQEISRLAITEFTSQGVNHPILWSGIIVSGDWQLRFP